MATPLTNSRRVVRLSSYTPVRLPPADGEADDGDVVTTAGLIRSLGIVPAELEALRRDLTTDEGRVAVRAIGELVQAASADRVVEAAASLGSVKRRALIAAVEQVRAARAAALSGATAALALRPDGAGAPSQGGDGRPTSGDSPRSERPASRVEVPAVEGVAAAAAVRVPVSVMAASRFRSSLGADLAAEAGARAAVVAWHPQSGAVTAAAPRPAAGASAPPMQTMSGGFGSAAVVRPDMLDLNAFLVFVEPYVPPGTDLATLDPLDALEELDRKTGACDVVIDALARRNVQPLGLLHLEELEMTPSEVQRGELVYSLPLAPKEKVTLSHKEWTVRESEFSEYVQDSIENYSERGVAETDEIAMSSQAESRKTQRTGMGSSDGVVMTGPADAGSTVVTEAQSQQESKRHAKTVTSQASSRSTRDHKVSFTVATVAGTEDFTSRLIENPKEDRAMRVDYFRRMKRWEVDLYRTGVRLAYDVVIPDPGRRLRLRQELVRRYDRALAASFNPGIRPTDVDRWNFTDYASAYGVALPAPPTDPDTSSVYMQWRMTCFAALRDAAYAKFSQVQETLRQRRAELSRQIDVAADADTLRQLEREEIARLVLAWLVPGFPGTGAAPGAAAEPQGLSDASWQQALEFGEYIKFVHAAVDWGRLTYFLYPYFWSDRQVDRLFLRHPDARHREFLRAGAARVVVPVVPGFEEELTSFVDRGRVGTLPDGHRFEVVVAAVREAQNAFAIVTTNDFEVTTRRTLIGSWTEFTPTGALDIDVVTMPVRVEA